MRGQYQDVIVNHDITGVGTKISRVGVVGPRNVRDIGGERPSEGAREARHSERTRRFDENVAWRVQFMENTDQIRIYCIVLDS